MKDIMSSDNLTVKEIVEDLQILRVRYELPDSSAFVRYEPRFDDSQPEELTVHSSWGVPSVGADKTGKFTLPTLVNELQYAYILAHMFPNVQAMEYFLAGFDTSLSQLEFIGGNYDFDRMWISSGVSNLGIPMAIFLGQRNAVNGQPSVTLVDHRKEATGQVVYRAVRGAGEHVGEDFYSEE